MRHWTDALLTDKGKRVYLNVTGSLAVVGFVIVVMAQRGFWVWLLAVVVMAGFVGWIEGRNIRRVVRSARQELEEPSRLVEESKDERDHSDSADADHHSSCDDR